MNPQANAAVVTAWTKVQEHYNAGKYTLAWRVFKSLPVEIQMTVPEPVRFFLVEYAFNAELV